MTDLVTWFHDEVEDKFYKILTYKKVWTPYELDKKYMDESIFEEGDEYRIVKILDLIELPDKDVLIKFQEFIECDWEKNTPSYLKECGSPFFEKLSNIKLYERIVKDDEDEEDEEEFEEVE